MFSLNRLLILIKLASILKKGRVTVNDTVISYPSFLPPFLKGL